MPHNVLYPRRRGAICDRAKSRSSTISAPRCPVSARQFRQRQQSQAQPHLDCMSHTTCFKRFGSKWHHVCAIMRIGTTWPVLHIQGRGMVGRVCRPRFNQNPGGGHRLLPRLWFPDSCILAYASVKVNIKMVVNKVMFAALAVARLAGAAVQYGSNHSSPSPPRPNFIFIMTDDQDLHLNSLDYMPAVRRHFTEQGTTFDRHYTTVSLCCPARVTLFTGRAAHNTNVTNIVPPYGQYAPGVQHDSELISR